MRTPACPTCGLLLVVADTAAMKRGIEPMRPRPRRAALGPVPGFGEKWLRTEPLRGPAMSKTHA